MAQYQSFPDAAGDSRTTDKLKALRLPSLEGRSFLDVGSNEGFFCGFARFAGSSRVVGLDKSRLFLERARRRFPDCEFVLGEWDSLPEGPFDVILLASALHYASDQSELIRRLVQLLSPNGTLVVELGIVSSPRSEWRRVKRGDDERLFPSMEKLKEVLEPYAWKWLGPSVDQSGDPVKRHVIHISRRRPVAYLLMEPPGYGKSTITRKLFADNGIPVVSGDEMVLQVARGKRDAPADLAELLAREFSPYRIDESIRRVFDSGKGPELVRLCAEDAGGIDFALDGYVPKQNHAEVEQILASEGFLPVRMTWQRPGMSLPTAETVEALTRGYLASLPELLPAPPAAVKGRGFVDALEPRADGVMVRGWAVGPGHESVARLELLRNGRLATAAVKAEARRDVQRKLALPGDRVGFRAMVECPAGWVDDPTSSLKVTAVFADGKRMELAYSSVFARARKADGPADRTDSAAPQE